MFQNQNTNKKTSDQEIDDLPVHTMRKDLEEIAHPNLKTKEQLGEATPIRPSNLTEAQKSSPFFSQTPVRKIEPQPVDETPRIISQRPAPEPIKVMPQKQAFESMRQTPQKPAVEPIKVAPTRPINEPVKKVVAPMPVKEPAKVAFKPVEPPIKIKEKDEQKKSSGKPLLLVLAVLVILVIVAGGYYFWLNQNQQTQEVAVTNVPEQTVEPQPEPVAKFSNEKPNIFTVDMSTSTTKTLRDALQNQAQDVSEEKDSFPVEFTVTGIDGQPVAFKDFAKALGITFSPALTANLADTFSLFIYNDQANTRLGIALNSKDPIALKKLVVAEEKTLAKDLSPIFLTDEYTLTPKTFASSNYTGLAIRYLNIISPEDLSVDYAISQNKLLIGTTKMTLRTIIDKITPPTVSPAE